MSKKRYLYKILVGGNAGVGKTSLLRRYVEGKFDDSTIMTVGVDFFIKELEFDSGTECTLQLWDFGGQERFRHLLENYVMGARGALLLIDLTRMPKMEKIVEWVNIIRLHDINLPIILVGTKFDLKDFVAIEDKDMLDIMNTFNMVGYVKTSAKTGHNVNKVFSMIATHLLKSKKY
ncbi:MAG: GTP-binding protein [Candidatus Lokiarchaeota archaeon]|nr:GTP-binding protein [Candidatus Lokiarchaeota archaeon]MBD3200647.1 GTP-binding protein [Candidatus Lokiarchaeota archaeon]